MRLGKGACHKNHQQEWVFQAPCNLLGNVPLVQQEDGQAPPVVMGHAGVEARREWERHTHQLKG